MSLFTLRRQTDRKRAVRRIEIAMSAALPNTGVPTSTELCTAVEQRIEAYLAQGSIDDGCGHVLDTWLRTREGDAQAALQELIDQQRQVDDVLVDQARARADRAEQRYSRYRARADRYLAAAQDCRHRALGATAGTVVAAPEPVPAPDRAG
ncbi:hypothetical protein [Rhodococcus ruber]|uniref:hypothetical protein n=1 Tax=Rhodococcus ruber TaxID=1830 RepID=UPI000C7A6347|nr:hypothetical protein [Rhodococcus ruber]AUM20270.1 hypothetical protein CSW53_27275 [Rhodococcus ruber]